MNSALPLNFFNPSSNILNATLLSCKYKGKLNNYPTNNNTSIEKSSFTEVNQYNFF